jgi:serine acetyltransferase
MITKLSISAVFGLDVLSVVCLRLAGVTEPLVIAAAATGIHIVVCAAVVRVLARLFPVPDGDHAKGSPEYDRWQALAFVLIISCNLFDRWLPILVRAQWYMLFGAKWPHSARIAGRILDCPLVEIDRDALLGIECLVTAHYETATGTRVGRVRIGRNATVGMRAVVLPGVTVEDGAIIGASALVPAGRRIPSGETWAGIPARSLHRAHPAKITLKKDPARQEVA